jgi:hypothetical protein
LFKVLKKTNYLCSYCNPERSKQRKTKENSVRDLFLTNNIEFVNDKRFKNDCCLRYRPDFLIDLNTFFLIVEVDENAHSQYPEECEIIRMNNISSGLCLPVKWIRYNPDQKGVTKKEKEEVLLQKVQEIMKYEYVEDLSVNYLFY